MKQNSAHIVDMMQHIISTPPDMSYRVNPDYRITTDHAASSYGQPVVEYIPTGTAYGRADYIPELRCTGAEYMDDPIFRS